MSTVTKYLSAVLCFLSLMGLVRSEASAQERVDTIWVSNLFTTHILFPTDIIYSNTSNTEDVESILTDASKELVSVQAYKPFDTTCNLTVMESNGTLRTYILQYRKHPRTLIIDEKNKVYNAPADTIEISTIYSSHLVYSSDIIYAHLSDSSARVEADRPNESKNLLAIRATRPFEDDAINVTVMEASGALHTYIINYREHPRSLVMNFQEGERSKEAGQQQVVSLTRKSDAPQLADVIEYPQTIHHLSTKKDGIRVTCENIFSYSDITYITLRIDNNAGVSFEADHSAFVVSTKQKLRNTIAEESTILPKASLGTLTVPAGGTSRIVYTFDKITLAKNQFFRVCVYEQNGRRDFFLDLTPKDINEAKSPKQLHLK